MRGDEVQEQVAENWACVGMNLEEDRDCDGPGVEYEADQRHAGMLMKGHVHRREQQGSSGSRSGEDERSGAKLRRRSSATWRRSVHLER